MALVYLYAKLVLISIKQMSSGGHQPGCCQLTFQQGAGMELWDQRIEGARRISHAVRAGLGAQ